MRYQKLNEPTKAATFRLSVALIRRIAKQSLKEEVSQAAIVERLLRKGLNAI